MNATHAESEPLDSLAAVDAAMLRMLKATLRHERLTAVRDEEVAAVAKRHAVSINKAALEIAATEAQIYNFYVSHRQDIETPEKKSVQLSNGLMGMRAPSNPALIPLDASWSWERITAKIRRIWKLRYFHKPKPPGLDKMRLKKELNSKALKRCGLALDTTEAFYLELNRLAMPDQEQLAEAA